MGRGRRRHGALAAGLATGLATVLLAGCGGSAGGESVALTGTSLEPQPFQVDPTPLVDGDGQPFSLADDTDRPLTLVFFGYIQCPDICQQVMAALSSAMTRLDEADRERVQVVFVTTDPARDDAAAVKAYAEQFGAEFVGVTGPMRDILTVADSFHVAVEKGEKLPSGGYDVTHGTQIFGVDADDEATVMWRQETSAAQFADDVHALLKD